MSEKRTSWVRTRQWLLPLLLLSGSAAVASAQRAHIGTRVGGNFDSKDAVAGAQVTAPLTRWLEVYPSVDAYFPSRGSEFGFNADLKAWLPTRPMRVGFYSGGGLNFLYRSVGGSSNTDPGVDLFSGIEARTGWVHPFAEGRVLWHDNTSFQLAAGLNFTLGGRR